MQEVVQKLESHAEKMAMEIPMPIPAGIAMDQRAGAVTPAQRLSRPLDTINVRHKEVKKICCIGAGYVGM